MGRNDTKTKIKKKLMRVSLELKFNGRKVVLSHEGPHDLFFEKKIPESQGKVRLA